MALATMALGGAALSAGVVLGGIGLASAASSGSAPAATSVPTSFFGVYKKLETTIPSFDGTPLLVNFFPAKGLRKGQHAPTVLEGSPWGLPAIAGWVGNITSAGIGSFNVAFDDLGPATLTADGYNVVTWDSRGLYKSGGQVQIDDPRYEGRDVSSIIDWLATLAPAELKAANDPVVGMTGVSYGGGIQLSAAIDDHRLAAIEPNLSWYSLQQSLSPNGEVKAGWGNLLCGVASLVKAHLGTVNTELCAASKSGVITPQDTAGEIAASPEANIDKITTPTLLLSGTVDTLFPLQQDIETYAALKAAGTPVQMVWYCGGHGICNLPQGNKNQVTDLELAFLNKYLKGAATSTGAAFQYQDQTGAWHSVSSYPLATTTATAASGHGSLTISTKDASGLLGIAATKAANAIDIPLQAPPTTSEVVGAPSLSMTYSGTATPASTFVDAQLVDTTTGKVLDNQATAIPVTLDGQTHQVTLPLNDLAWQFGPTSHVELQITDGSDLFFAQRSAGSVDVHTATLTLPYSQG